MSCRPVAAVAGLLCLATAACGTGQQAQTYKKHSYDYVNAELGDVAIRNLAIDGPADGTGIIPAGGTAKVTGTFVSQADSDSLTAAASPVAASTTIQQDGRTVQEIAVPRLGRAAGWTLVLANTSKPLRAGSYVDLMLTFAKGGRQTFHVPVRSNQFYSGAADQSAQPDASPSGTGPAPSPSPS